MVAHQPDLDGPERTVDLREYVAILRARRWTVALVTMLVAGLAVGLSAIRTPLYSAEARVLVETPVAAENPLLLNIETERQIVASQPVAALARERLDNSVSLDGLLGAVTVIAPPEASVLSISYTSPDRRFARDAANAFAEAYIAYKRERQTGDFAAEEEALQDRLGSAQRQLATLADEIEAAEEADDEALATTLENTRTALIARVGVLQQRLDDLEATRATRVASGEVIEAAELPTAPSSPNYVTNAILGVLLGVALGVGLAFVRERLDDRFRGREDVERVTGVPVLATIPRFKAPRRHKTPALITVARPKGVSSEAYRGLRTNLLFVAATQGFKSMVVTSAQAGEGKTVTASNLAVVLAQAGSRVILISADLRRPTVERQFGLERTQEGLSTWLASPHGAPPWSLLVNPGMKNLRLLPSGAIPPNPAELLTSPRFAELIPMLEENADFVIFDSPPVLAVADSSIISAQTGGALLVIDSTSTHRSAVRHATAEVQRAGGKLIGCLLNSLDPSSSPYYYGPYRYDYGEKHAAASDNGLGTGKTSTRRRHLSFRR